MTNLLKAVPSLLIILLIISIHLLQLHALSQALMVQNVLLFFLYPKPKNVKNKYTSSPLCKKTCVQLLLFSQIFQHFTRLVPVRRREAWMRCVSHLHRSWMLKQAFPLVKIALAPKMKVGLVFSTVLSLLCFGVGENAFDSDHTTSLHKLCNKTDTPADSKTPIHEPVHPSQISCIVSSKKMKSTDEVQSGNHLHPRFSMTCS